METAGVGCHPNTIRTTDRHNYGIYSEEQRAVINSLIEKGYVPTETVVGKGKCTRRHWNLEPYSGKKGEGFRMISSYPWASNFNSITFFIRQEVA